VLRSERYHFRRDGKWSKSYQEPLKANDAFLQEIKDLEERQLGKLVQSMGVFLDDHPHHFAARLLAHHFVRVYPNDWELSLVSPLIGLELLCNLVLLNGDFLGLEVVAGGVEEGNRQNFGGSTVEERSAFGCLQLGRQGFGVFHTQYNLLCSPKTEGRPRAISSLAPELLRAQAPVNETLPLNLGAI
jgi:hypothetical protein